jgi:uncharacterized membrane-anchored protein
MSSSHRVVSLSKIPLVIAYFRASKILKTGMSEAASDWLVKLGGVVTVGLTFVVLIASLVVQFKVTRWVY